MADQTYPNLRPPLIEGYGLDQVDPIARTEFDYGTSRSRRRYKKSKTLIDCLFRFREDEYAVFASWFELTIDGGREWFSLPLRTGDGTYTDTRCKFATITRPVKNSGLWDVTATLEIEQTQAQANTLTQEHIDAFVTYGAHDFAVFETLFNQQVNDQWLAVWYD